MAIITFTGFEGGAATLEPFSVSGTTSFDTSTVRTGIYSLRCNPTATNGGFVNIQKFGASSENAVLAIADLYTQFYVRFASLPTGANLTEFFEVNNSDGSITFNARIDSAGKINVFNNATQLGSAGTTVLSTGVWYQIRIRVQGTTTGAYSLSIDGVSEFSGTSDFGNFNTNIMFLGIANKTNTTDNTDTYFDDVVLDDSTFPSGAASVKSIVPTANGTTMTWSGGTGASDYTQVDEIPADDADYVQSPTTGNPNTALFAMQDTSTVGISGTILALTGVVRSRENTSVTSAHFTRINSGASNSDSTSFNGTTSVVRSGKLTLVDPATSTAWTTSGIDSVQIGMVENNAVATRATTVVGFVLYIPAIGPTNIKSYNTNVFANIKSIDTNLIANVKSLDTNV